MIKKNITRTIAISVVFILSMVSFNVPVMAAPLGSNNVNILTNCAEADDGITCILKLVVDILSIGVGILGVIGISVAGIQYLTAGGSEEKTRKAKRRLFEIVIGLAAYAVIYAFLNWLLPSFPS